MRIIFYAKHRCCDVVICIIHLFLFRFKGIMQGLFIAIYALIRNLPDSNWHIEIGQGNCCYSGRKGKILYTRGNYLIKT